MPKIIVDGQSKEVPEGLTIIQVCDSLGIQIPRFCYHEKLPIVGNCRMCLVEVSNSKKLVPSCATMVSEGMEIKTKSDAVNSARKSVLEVFLVNHPLDCPICDKGGECDLQDQTYRYGLDKSRIHVPKRAVEEKDFGPLIDSYMTRCIHCTKCIRFATEIAGVEEIGGLGRGDLTEINTYVTKSLTSELSGNIADVCPVGALTHSTYAFKARPWELKSTETIDIMDALGSNIKVDSTSLAVLRIMPRINESLNEYWLADKSRYIVDALRVQRLDIPMVRNNGKLEATTWDNAFSVIANRVKFLKSQEIAGLVGDFVDCETSFIFKKLLTSLGTDNIDCRFGINYDITDRGSYLFNTTIAGIDQADACLIIGSNPRVEAPLLNARLRKRYLKGDFSIGVIGEKYDGNYAYDHIGTNLSELENLLSNDEHFFAKKLKSADRPMLILGLGAFKNNNISNVISLVKKIAIKYNMIQPDWNGYNVLNTSTGLLSALESGFVSSNKDINVESIINGIRTKSIKFIWLNNVDSLDFSSFSKDTFVVYQGHHGDIGASHADVILPSNLWLEQEGTYVNLEGRLQRSYKAVPSVGESKPSWKIIRKFSEYINLNLQIETLEDLQKEMALYNSNFTSLGIKVSPFKESTTKFDHIEYNEEIKSFIENYYITDIISRNSLKMAECTRFINKKQ